MSACATVTAPNEVGFPGDVENRAAYGHLSGYQAAAGRVRPIVGQALERAADAHAAIESRAIIGKTLLTVAP